jgi:hypothetical protein
MIEVNNFDLKRVSIENNVFRLEVSMNVSKSMKLLDSFDHLHEDFIELTSFPVLLEIDSEVHLILVKD